MRMDITAFWAIVDAARLDAASLSGDPREAIATALTDRLAATSKQTILEYQERFDQLHDAVYRWDVWAAAYLIGGGCSDDSFMDFRAGLIAQGRDWYERAASAPDRLADHPDVIAGARKRHDWALFCESANYAAPNAYDRIGGDKDEGTFYDDFKEFRATREPASPTDMGEDFDFDDAAHMHARLPRLAALFLRAETI
jgi:hypothetical protein